MLNRKHSFPARTENRIILSDLLQYNELTYNGAVQPLCVCAERHRSDWCQTTIDDAELSLCYVQFRSHRSFSAAAAADAALLLLLLLGKTVFILHQHRSTENIPQRRAAARERERVFK